MRGAVAIFALFLLALSCRAQYVPPAAVVEPLKPVGIRISVPVDRLNGSDLGQRRFIVCISDEPGITLVAFHVKFNEDFEWLEAGTIAVDIIKAKNGRWTYHDKSTRLKEGDIVYYWVHVVYNGLGYNLVDQKYRVSEFYDYNGKKIEDRINVNENDNSQSCVSSATKIYESSGFSRYPCAGQLIFQANFKDSENFKRSRWTVMEQFSTKPDYEFVLYRNAEDNIKIDNKLKITPQLITDEEIVKRGSVKFENCTGREGTVDCIRNARGYNILPPVGSARINTKKAFNFQYGRVEIKAKLPKGDWVYPLLMLEPVKGPDDSAGSPLQIRIASSAGNADLRADNKKDISGHILWGGVINSNVNNIYDDRINSYRSTEHSTDLWSEDFHVYELTWDRNEIILKVDGMRYDETRNIYIPEDMPFYLTLGVAVGGIAEFPENCVSNGYNKSWSNTDPKALLHFYNSKDKWHGSWDDSTALTVEYVKIWAL